MRKLIVFITLWVCMTGHVFAQTFTLSGIVKHSQHNEPVEFANVILQTTDSVFFNGTTTGMDGDFSIPGIPSEPEALIRLSIITKWSLRTDLYMLLTKEPCISKRVPACLW